MLNDVAVDTVKIKWGIIAPGRIAHAFASDLLLSDGSELVAVASRSPSRADAFAQKYAIDEVYYDYNELVLNSRCDIVYIASPHAFHKEQTLACIRAGKSVLCEKPVGLSAAEMDEMVQAAKEHNVFFMEAMWTRFFPVMEHVMSAIAEGKIGAVNLVHANFGFKAKADFTDRLFDPALGGGSLLDTGVYVISLAQMIYNTLPQEILTQSVMTPTGVDGTGTYLLRYVDNQLAQLSSSIVTQTVNSATIYGEEGYITLENFWMPSRAVFHFSDGREEVIEYQPQGTGYFYEIKHVEACLAEKRIESPKRKWQETRDVLSVMDSIRNRWGLVYPGEK